MTASTLFISYIRSSTKIVTVLVAFLATAQFVLAAENTSYNVSTSWFKPTLTVNNDPKICKPLLDAYLNYFKSSQTTNPLHADIYGTRPQNDSTAIITKNLRELEWQDIQIDGVALRIAEVNLNGKYYAIVRRNYSLGWREGYFNDILINKPFAEYHLNKENHEEYFETYDFKVLAPGSKKNIFDVVYKYDPRSKNYESNIYGDIANIYVVNGSLYITFVTDKPQPDTYMILKLLDQNKFFLIGSLQTTPSDAQIKALDDKLPAFKELKVLLSDMMGKDSCGISIPKQRLYDALDIIPYRPWINSFVKDGYHIDQPATRQAVDKFLESWGYSGIWNYYKYKSYLDCLPKAEIELKNFFAKKFDLSEINADELAQSSISYALIVGFCYVDNYEMDYDLHKRILEGMSAEDLIKESITEQAEFTGTDSLLAFAILHPKLVKVLLEKGLNPNKTNAFGKTPLMYAAQFNSLESAQLLLEYGAYTEATTIDSGDRCNYAIAIKNLSALHYAVRYASMEFIKLLLDYGAPTYIEDSEGYTPYDYLVKFGGFEFEEGYRQPRNSSCGDLNQNLTDDDRKALKLALLPLDDSKKIALSQEENLKAEKLYQQGKLQDAYRLLRRAVTLNPDNERYLSNLSLVALKLGYLGESAKISTRLIKMAKSDEQKARAYFNLGLACQKAEYDFFEYEGTSYCSPDCHRQSYIRNDRSTFSDFLTAYKLKPTQVRLNAILSLLQNTDMDNKKKVCKFPKDGSGVKSLYFGCKDLYFLIDSSKEVPFKKAILRKVPKDKELMIASKENIPLTDNLKLEHWILGDNSFLWSEALVLDNKICSQLFPIAFEPDTKLISVYLSRSGHPHSSPRNITLKQEVASPVLLILCGNQLTWILEGDLSKTLGIHVIGDSTVQLPPGIVIPIATEKRFGFPDPKSDFFNQYIRSRIGLSIDSMIEVGEQKNCVY